MQCATFVPFILCFFLPTLELDFGELGTTLKTKGNSTIFRDVELLTYNWDWIGWIGWKSLIDSLLVACCSALE